MIKLASRRFEDDRIWRRAILLVVLGTCFTTSGCHYLAQRVLTPVWGVVPLVLCGVLGLAVAWQWRRVQLLEWMLPQPKPNGFAIKIAISVGSAVFLLAFLVYNITRSFLDPVQIALNVGAWLLGSVIGTVIALWLAFRMGDKA